MNGTVDWTLFQQWQTATMTKVLEQKDGTPQAQRKAALEALAAQQEQQRLLRAQRSEELTRQAIEFRENRQRKKAAKRRQEQQRIAASKQAERDRLQRQILEQQRAINNQQLPFWKQRR